MANYRQPWLSRKSRLRASSQVGTIITLHHCILLNTQSLVMREQHEAEMAQLESLVSSSRGLLRKQNKRFLEQVIRDMVIMRMINSRDYSKVDKLVLADSVIEQLLVDNDRLTDELGRLKENFKVTDI